MLSLHDGLPIWGGAARALRDFVRDPVFRALARIARNRSGAELEGERDQAAPPGGSMTDTGLHNEGAGMPRARFVAFAVNGRQGYGLLRMLGDRKSQRLNSSH